MSDKDALPVTMPQLALIGAGAIVIGAFLPWVTTSAGGRAGITSIDGIATLAAGAIVGGYILFRSFNQRVVLVGGGVCSIIGAYDTAFPLSVEVLGVGVASGFRSPGIGVYLTLFGGLTLLGVGIAERADE